MLNNDNSTLPAINTYCPFCDDENFVALDSHNGRMAKRCSKHQPTGKAIPSWYDDTQTEDDEDELTTTALPFFS